MTDGSEITDEDLVTFKRDGFLLKKAMYTQEEVSLLHDIAKGEQYATCGRRAQPLCGLIDQCA